jgi:hypothetical protein
LIRVRAKLAGWTKYLNEEFDTLAQKQERHRVATSRDVLEWSDAEFVWEAIETIDPLKITVRDRPVAIIGFDGDGYIPIRQLIEMLMCDDHTCCIIDPCLDPEAIGAEVGREFGDVVWFTVVGVARLDLANEATYRALLTALKDSVERFDLEMPYIEF